MSRHIIGFEPERRTRRHPPLALSALFLAGLTPGLFQAQTAPVQGQAAPGGSAAPAQERTQAAPASPEPGAGASQRANVNLVGQTDTQSGESRRNDNVQLTPLDNNVLKELNQRIGTTATVVREFAPDRSFFSAEYGNQPAASLYLPPARTRAGIHGNIMASHLNSVVSARSFYQVGDVKPSHENQFTFDATSPIWRNANLSLQGSRQAVRKMVNGNVLVPLPDERTALAQDPALNAFVQKLLDFYPRELPNRTDIDRRMLNTNSRQVLDGYMSAARLDQTLGGNQKLSFRYQWIAQKLLPFEFVAGMNPDSTTRSHQARILWARGSGASTVWTASLGFDRVASVIVADPSYTGPTISTGGLTNIGTSGDVPINEADNLYSWGAQMRRIHGSHTITAGFEARRRHYNGVRSFSMKGVMTFSRNYGVDAITNLRLGHATIMYKAVGDTNRAYRGSMPVFYAGDSWRAASKLTLTLGLRYEPVPPPTEAHGRTPLPYGCDCNNLAPTAGLAYRLGAGWGAVRAAYALQYGVILPSVFATMRYNLPYYNIFVLPAPNLLDPYSGLGGAAAQASATIFAADTVNPYAHQFNFAWETNITPPWRLELGYVGSRTFRLIQSITKNRGTIGPGIAATSANVNERRPNQSLTEVFHTMSEVSYWFSKSLDLGTNYNDISGPVGNLNQWEFESHKDLKERSNFDQPHSLLVRFAYDLPKMTPGPSWLGRAVGGWSISGVALLKAGTPFSVMAGSDAPGFGNVDGAMGDRPNVVAPSILGRTVGNPDTSRLLLPRSAFSFIEPGGLRGNLGLNTFRKGSIRNVNARFGRAFPAGGDRTLRFDAESINLFNTPQFAAPGYRLTDPDFGAITNTLNEGRTFRFSLGVSF